MLLFFFFFSLLHLSDQNIIFNKSWRLFFFSSKIITPPPPLTTSKPCITLVTHFLYRGSNLFGWRRSYIGWRPTRWRKKTSNFHTGKCILCYCRCFIEMCALIPQRFGNLIISYDNVCFRTSVCSKKKNTKKQAIDMKPTGETRYVLSCVHKRTISVHFTDIMLGLLRHMFTALF